MGQYSKSSGGFSGLKENVQFLNVPPHNLICSCSRFLNPFPAAAAANGNSPSMHHFCRVCNIRLNSCRQARIHADGKKHTKHLHYLQMCLLEATTTRKENLPRYSEPPSISHFNNYTTGGVGMGSAAPANTSYPNAICQIQFANCPGSACNALFYHPMPTPQPATFMPFLPFQTFPNYQDLHHTLQQQQMQQQTLPSPLMAPPPPQPMNNINHHHHLMSPSLTSGFSGSGPDCKSMETGSVLSTSSSSNLPHIFGGGQQQQQNHHHFNQKAKSFVTRNQLVWCRLCHMSFPSQQMLESHLSAVRHSRKTIEGGKKSHASLPNLGVTTNGNGNEIKCQVCQVSVNSEQQLVAHLAGQKHRIRAVRQGLKPDQALASPSSSTLTSASESENGYPINDGGGGQQKLRRRSSEFNLLRPQQSHPSPLVGNGSLLRQRCYTTCGGGGVPAYSLSRYLSSSCLNRACSRSTTSLRKAVSHTALHKCRSMNLLNGSFTSASARRKKRVEEDKEEDEDDDEEEDGNLQSLWPRRGSDNSSSDQEAMQAASTSEEEYYRNQNVRQDNKASNSIAKLANRATRISEPASSSSAPCQRHTTDTKGNKAMQQRTQPATSSALGRKHSNYANSASFMEIPMLNLFLHRLNQHSLRKKTVATAAAKPLASNDSDFSNNES